MFIRMWSEKKQWKTHFRWYNVGGQGGKGITKKYWNSIIKNMKLNRQLKKKSEKIVKYRVFMHLLIRFFLFVFIIKHNVFPILKQFFLLRVCTDTEKCEKLLRMRGSFRVFWCSSIKKVLRELKKYKLENCCLIFVFFPAQCECFCH